jgi:hypothetical protein
LIILSRFRYVIEDYSTALLCRTFYLDFDKIDGIANTKNTQNARKFYNLVSRGTSTEAKKLLHYPKVLCSNPVTTAGSERVKMEKYI